MADVLLWARGGRNGRNMPCPGGISGQRGSGSLGEGADPILATGRPGSIDCGHVHKPSVFYENGVLYHFYCATRPWQDGDATSRDGEFRTICVAASRPVWDCMEAEVNEEARGARW